MRPREYEIVVIGASLGGLHALGIVLGSLPQDFELPVAIVQHRWRSTDRTGGDGLSAFFMGRCRLPVSEPCDKDPIEAGRVYVAPPDYHLLVDGQRFALSTEAVVNYSRPAVDVLFESAAEAYGRGVVGVVLTGSNEDGARGLARIRRAGGLGVIQDPETAEAPAMPAAALREAGADHVLALPELGVFLASLGPVKRRAGAPGTERDLEKEKGRESEIV